MCLRQQPAGRRWRAENTESMGNVQNEAAHRDLETSVITHLIWNQDLQKSVLVFNCLYNVNPPATMTDGLGS